MVITTSSRPSRWSCGDRRLLSRSSPTGTSSLAGATDDKGQVLTHILAVCDALADGGTLPMQVKFLIEGEEEVGSGNLESHLPGLAELLACDVVVVSDSSQYGPGRPAITTGLRGIATYEITVTGPVGRFALGLLWRRDRQPPRWRCVRCSRR